MRGNRAGTLTPEFAFLVAATRWPHDEAALAAIRDAAAAITDPARLLALTGRHHATGLVARALGHCPPFAGTPLHAAIAAEAREQAAEQFRQLVQTRAAIAALRKAGVAVASIKGAPVALCLYGEAGLRRSVDIDLLIDRADLTRAAAVLERGDYRRSAPPHDASPRRVHASLRRGKDWGFDHFGSDTGIELHWRLFQNPMLLGGVSVRDAVEAEVAPGIALPVLPRRLAMLHLVAHGAEHGWSRLKWLADLCALLRKAPEAAERLLDDAAGHALVDVTAAALRLCHEIYATPLPPRAAARGWRAARLLAIARASLTGLQDGTELEDVALAATRKNLSHYLFSASPRYWAHELAYDLFHDAADSEAAGGDGADGGGTGDDRTARTRIARRAANLLRLPAAALASGPSTGSG